MRRADSALYVRIRSLARHPHGVRWVCRYSALGEYSGLWLAFGAGGTLLARGPRQRRAWLRATLAVAAAHGASAGVKTLFGRRRPAFANLPHLIATPTGLSFPSSHAAGSFAALRAYGQLVPGEPLAAAAATMAISRVLLGVHYPSDIAAGALLGAVVGSFGRSSPCR